MACGTLQIRNVSAREFIEEVCEPGRGCGSGEKILERSIRFPITLPSAQVCKKTVRDKSAKFPLFDESGQVKVLEKIALQFCGEPL